MHVHVNLLKLKVSSLIKPVLTYRVKKDAKIVIHRLAHTKTFTLSMANKKLIWLPFDFLLRPQSSSCLHPKHHENSCDQMWRMSGPISLGGYDLFGRFLEITSAESFWKLSTFYA